jgi:uncharacterized membrane protein YvlD (DUF360 family)
MSRTVAVRSLIRLVVAWVINALGLLILSAIVPGFDIDPAWHALWLAAVIAVLMATVRPLLVWATLRFIVITGGILGLVLSAIVVLLSAWLTEGVELSGLGSATIVVLGMGLVNTVGGALLPYDDDLSYFRGVTRRQGRRALSDEMDDGPGVVFFEIDGLAEDILGRAIDAGHVPTMKRWLEEGTHVLTPWECDLSSQTGASQAGLLHGDNHDMPGFRWYEKDTGKTVVSNHPDDAAANEAGFPDGKGLLRGGGSAIGNMFSGEAKQSLFTMSRISDNYRTRVPAIFAFFQDPQNYMRLIYLSIHDIWLERRAARRQRRDDEHPRVSRGGTYPLVRAATTVVLRELGVYTTIAEMYRGVPSMYATYVGYDEVAHHSGPEASDALAVLHRLDKQLARLERAAVGAPRPYRIVVLSDHGQSRGAPFRQRTGETIEELVRRLIASSVSVRGARDIDEGFGAISVALSETASSGGATGALTQRALRKRTVDGQVELGPADNEPNTANGGGSDDDAAVVLVSGGLSLIYFPGIEGRATLEQIDALAPGLVSALAGQDGIGFVMVRTASRGAVVTGAAGSNYIDENVIEGQDPLGPFGVNAKAHVARTDGFANCPDILVNGAYDPNADEFAAFEEFVGSHGALGGAQMHPFLLYPVELEAPDARLVGAERVHEVLRSWCPVGTDAGGRPADDDSQQ